MQNVIQLSIYKYIKQFFVQRIFYKFYDVCKLDVHFECMCVCVCMCARTHIHIQVSNLN